MKILYRYHLYLLFTIILILLSFIYLLKDITPNIISIDKLPKNYPINVIEPINMKLFVTEGQIIVPSVSKKLNDIYYPLMVYKEEFDVKDGKYDLLFIATKRIQELYSWNSEIPILRSFNINRSLKIRDIKTWGDNQKHEYNSWEASLARYLISMDKAIDSLCIASDSCSNAQELENSLIGVKEHILFHKETLKQTIFDLKIRPGEKKYLYYLSDMILTYLDNKINELLPEYNPQQLIFYPSATQLTKEYGKYNLILDTSSIPENIKDNLSFFENDKFKQTDLTFFSQVEKENSELHFNNIKIDKNTQSFSLRLPYINYIPQKTEFIKSQDANTGGFKYTFDFLANNNSSNDLIFQVSHHFMNRSSIKLEIVESQDNNANEEIITHIVLLTLTPYINKDYYQKLINLATSKPNLHFRLTLSSLKEITQDELNTLELELIPYFRTELFMQKRESVPYVNTRIDSKKISNAQYLITTTHLSENTNVSILSSLGYGWKLSNKLSGKDGKQSFIIINKPYFISIYSLLLTYLIFIFLIGKKFIFKFFPSSIFKIRVSLNKSLLKISISKYLDMILFLVFILGLYYDIYQFKAYFNFLVLGISIVWILTIIRFKFSGYINYFISCLFLAFTARYIIAEQRDIAEKFAIWSYIFLIIGTFQFLIYYLRFSTVPSYNLSQFLRKSTSQLINLIHLILSFVINLLFHIVKLVFLIIKFMITYIFYTVKLLFSIIKFVTTYIIHKLKKPLFNIFKHFLNFLIFILFHLPLILKIILIITRTIIILVHLIPFSRIIRIILRFINPIMRFPIKLFATLSTNLKHIYITAYKDYKDSPAFIKLLNKNLHILVNSAHRLLNNNLRILINFGYKLINKNLYIIIISLYRLYRLIYIIFYIYLSAFREFKKSLKHLNRKNLKFALVKLSRFVILLIFFLVFFSAIIISVPRIVLFTADVSKKTYILLELKYRIEQQKKIAEKKRISRLAMNPVITKIQPQIVYRSSKVIVTGKNFGWKPSDDPLKIMSSQGEIAKDLWNETKIIFTIPLHMKDGEIFIWIEKPINWEGKINIQKSEIFKIKLLPTTENITLDDEAYFEQLKHLDEETLKLNGY